MRAVRQVERGRESIVFNRVHACAVNVEFHRGYGESSRGVCRDTEIVVEGGARDWFRDGNTRSWRLCGHRFRGGAEHAAIVIDVRTNDEVIELLVSVGSSGAAQNGAVTEVDLGRGDCAV